MQCFVIAFFVGLVIICGIKRIATMASRLVPTMAILYVGGALFVIFSNAKDILPAFATILGHAFSLEAGWGGLITVIMWGIRPGLYSTEAGPRPAPIAPPALQAGQPARRGSCAI